MLTEKDSSLVAIGVGSNLGHKKKNISCALRLIHGHKNCEIVSVSHLYQTSPWGEINQDFFLNAVTLVKTKVLPEDFLDILFSIERNLKRERGKIWGPRTIDLDILLYGDHQYSTDRLTIPHPYMTERAFVLIPLADVSPHMLIHDCSVLDWINRIDTSGVRVIDQRFHWWLSDEDLDL